MALSHAWFELRYAQAARIDGYDPNARYWEDQAGDVIAQLVDRIGAEEYMAWSIVLPDGLSWKEVFSLAVKRLAASVWAAESGS